MVASADPVEFEMAIEAGKVREFARACKSSSPGYLQEAAPVIPPTFLTTQAFWLDEDLLPMLRMGLDLTRTLHAEQEYEFTGSPPRAGTRLTGKSWIDERYEKEGRRGGRLTFVVMKTEYRDAEGRLVATARTTAVQTSRPPTEQPA